MTGKTSARVVMLKADLMVSQTSFSVSAPEKKKTTAMSQKKKPKKKKRPREKQSRFEPQPLTEPPTWGRYRKTFSAVEQGDRFGFLLPFGLLLRVITA